MSRKKLMLIVVGAVVVIGVIIGLATVKVTPSSGDGAAAPSVTLSESGVYYAECMIPGAGTLLGQVEAGSEEHPSQMPEIQIKNMNSGELKTVKTAEATCTFTPVTAEN